MKEVKGTEINEIKKPEPENFKNIKAENGTNVEQAKEFWQDVFNKSGDKIEDVTDKIESQEFGPQYNSEKHMIDYTPAEDSPKGKWVDGPRGNAVFIPNENTEAGLKAKEKLAEYGQDGIRYINGEPDFSKCSEAIVTIGNMTENRDDYIGADGEIKLGNFSQANIKCAEKWNAEAKDGKSDWTARDVEKWKDEHNCTWHECCDTKTMNLVSKDIHNTQDPIFTHSGGVSECKARDAVNIGGGFDE